MRASHVKAAIGLSAAVFSGLLLSAPAVEQPDGVRLDALTVNEARHHRDQSMEGQQLGDRQRQPLLAAIAPVNYDCWAEALPMPTGAPMSAECHQHFLQAFEGMPDNDHRWLISSVGPGQFVAATSDDTAATESPPPAQHGNDSIGALILSLSSPGLPRRGAAHESAPAFVHAAGQQPSDGQKNGQLVDNCDASCLAMSFSGPGAAPLIDDHDRNFRGPGDSGAGQQSANAGGTNSSSGNNGQGNNGPGSNNSGGGVGSGGSGSGSGGSGSPGGGSSGSGGPGSGGPGSGGPGSGGPGSGGPGDGGDGGDGGPGGGHGHGHGHSGGG